MGRCSKSELTEFAHQVTSSSDQPSDGDIEKEESSSFQQGF